MASWALSAPTYSVVGITCLYWISSQPAHGGSAGILCTPASQSEWGGGEQWTPCRDRLCSCVCGFVSSDFTYKTQVQRQD